MNANIKLYFLPLSLKCIIAFLLAMMPILSSAQTGRTFVSVEAYAGFARIIHVGKIVEIKKINYESEQPLEHIQKMGKPYRVIIEVTETIKGDDTKRLELILSLQNSYYLEHMREHSLEFMLVGGRHHLDSYPSPKVGIEEQGERMDGEWYQFRLLDLLKIPDSKDDASIVKQLNSYYDNGKMFTNELKIIQGREAILKRVRAFSKEHNSMLSGDWLRIPNEFAALCGSTNAYCGLTLPRSPSTMKTLAAFKADPDLFMKRITNGRIKQSDQFMIESAGKILAFKGDRYRDSFSNPVHLFESILIPAFMHCQEAKVKTSWKEFYLRTDTLIGLKNKLNPSAEGIHLNVLLSRVWGDSEFADTTSMNKGVTIRKLKFPGQWTMNVEFKYGARANKDIVEMINQSIDDIMPEQRAAAKLRAETTRLKKSANPSEEAQNGAYRTIPRFGIPDEFDTMREFEPKLYLNVLKVEDTKAKLTHSEKLSAALLIIAADHATSERSHWIRSVSLNSPLLKLLLHNFKDLDKLEPSKDLDPHEISLRDLGTFFRTWMKEDLSKELQQKRRDKE